MFNLRNRSFLKEIDFEPAELRFLLQLAEAPQDGEVRRHRDAATSTARRSPSSSRRPRPGPGPRSRWPPTTRGRTSPTSTRPARSSATRSRSPTPPGCWAACTTPSSSAATPRTTIEELARHAGVPVYNGLTNEWHPTQMLADFLTMHEASHKPYDELAYAFVGDCRFNMGRSLLVMGALMGADVRLGGPPDLQPPSRRREDRPRHRRAHRRHASPSPPTRPRPWPASTSSTPTSGSRWARPRSVWLDRVQLLTPYQVNRALLEASGNPKVRFMHCLPAFHDTNTEVGRRDHGRDRHDQRARGHRRGVRVAGGDRLRPGREPAAHHQGRPGRHARPRDPAGSRVEG